VLTRNQVGAQIQPIESIEFADGTVWSAADIDERISGNRRPRIVAPLANQAALVEQPFSFSVPADAFADPNAGDPLVYSAVQSDGSPLPAWLQFDPMTRTFSGTRPSVDNIIYSIRVVATDPSGLTGTDDF